MQSLLRLAERALGEHLCWGSGDVDLSALPEPELALDVWGYWQEQLEAAARPAAAPRSATATGRSTPLPQRRLEVIQAFAAAFWRPQLLRLAYPTLSIPRGLASLQLVAERLLHLELCAPGLWHLDSVTAACPQLRCLSLRGCTRLHDSALEALVRCSSLQGLDLGGLSSLSDGTVYHIAKLPHLAACNLSGTAITDRALELLTYGHKVRAWQSAAGAVGLPAEAACWPPLPLEHLQLEGTHVGPAGVAELVRLPALRFLDCRGTGLARAALAPLQRRFALQFVQGAVLSSTNSAAYAVVNHNAVVCRCGMSGQQAALAGSAPSREAALRSWEATGVQLLLQYDPTAGLAGALEPHRRPLAWRPGGGAAGGAAAAAAAAAKPGGRRLGYRERRQP